MEGIFSKAGQVLLPGDIIACVKDFDELVESEFKLGPGLRLDGDKIVAFKYGVLRHKDSPLSMWVDTNQKRYVPVRNDSVLGLVAARGAEGYKIDIGCAQLANLDALAFEGATKRHKPNLKISDIVYGKLVLAEKDMEPEISCLDEGGKSNGLGPICGGYTFAVSLGLSRKLLEVPQSKILSLLGKHFPFEIVVGMNGRVWINSKGIIDTIAIANAIVSSEFMLDEQVDIMVKQLVSSIAGFNEDEPANDNENMDEANADSGNEEDVG